MDRKEAIEILENWASSSRRTEKRLGYINGWFYEEDEEAFRMAIEALQKYDDCVEAFKEMLELKVLTEGKQCTHCLYNPEHPFTVNCSEIPTGSNLISRQMAIERVVNTGYADPIKENIVSILRTLPSAEPRTGTCKDCTHWDKLDYEAPRQGWCNQFEDWTDADEYCSRCAKMRGEEE